MKKMMTLGLSFILILLVTACGTHLKGGQPEAPVVSNGKIALQQGDYIYYINGSMPATVDQALSPTKQSTVFRMNPDGSDKQQLSTDKAYDFYVYGDTVYYLGPASETMLAVYKTTINGGTSRKVYSIKSGDTYCFGPGGIAVERDNNLVLIQPKTDKQVKIKEVGDIAQIYMSQTNVYYTITNRAGVNRLDYQGQNSEKVAERNGRILGIDGNTLYYIKSDEYLNKVDMADKTETQLSNTIYQTMQLSIKNNAIVGVDKDKAGLYVMKLDGSTRVKLSDQIITAYILSDTEIYYYDSLRMAIYAVDYNGENERKLADAQAVPGPGETGTDYYMDIVGDNLYFFDSANGGKTYSVNLTGTPQLKTLQAAD